MHFVEIAHRVLVEDDDVRFEPLEPPVLLRLQRLPHERQVVADDAHEQDRQVAGDAVRPQTALAEHVRRDDVRRRAASIRPPTARAKRAARTGPPPRRRCPGDGDRSARAPARARTRVTRRGDRDRSARGPQPCPDRRQRRWRNRAAPRRPEASRTRCRRLRNGIEDDAGRSRQGAAVERDRVRDRPAAPDEARAIRFPLDRPLRPPLEAHDVHRPQAALPDFPRAPVRKQRRALGEIFGLDEQLAERRMREVVFRRSEHDLRVARHVDLADPEAAIGQLQAADLDIVFGGDGDIERRDDVVVATVERRFLRKEQDRVSLRLATSRVEGRRPDRAAPHVAQIDELAAVIARRIPPGACDVRVRAQTLATTACVGDTTRRTLPFDRNCVCGNGVCGVR